MSNVTTSIVVNFSAEASGSLTAEIDSRPEGYNGGRTSFTPGDSPAFLVFKSAGVDILEVEPSAGNIADLAGGTVEVEEFLTFANAVEASLSKPITGGLTYKWLGNNLGVPVVVGDTKVRVPTSGVGVLKVVYQSTFLAYLLSGLGTTLNGESDYEVLVVITGEQT